MIRWPRTEKPHQNIGNKVTVEENGAANPFIKEIQNGAEEQQRKSIGNKMKKITVNHWCKEDTDQSMKRSRVDPQVAKVDAIKKFNAEGQPHDKHEPERHYRTTKQLVFGGHQMPAGSLIIGSFTYFASASPTDFIPNHPPEDSATFKAKSRML